MLGVLSLLLFLVYPVSAVGIFRNSDGNWYLDYNFDGVVDKTLHFGGPNDIPVTGNWQGAERDSIAIFRPSTGYWYFDYNLDGIVDKFFRYGGSTDRIIKGDWDGDGKDGIAIFRPSTGYWYFDYNLDGIVDKFFRYGGSTDRIIKGDWDGDGKDGIAIFRPSTGYWYFDYDLDGKIDKFFRYGGSTDEIIDEDWQRTGRDGIAIFRPSTGYWYFDNDLDGIVDKFFRYGGSSDQIISGKWYCVAPVAAFTADVREGYAPLTVRFTNQSTGTAPITYAWDFDDDGTIDRSEPSPNFTFTDPGTYTVNLTVSNAAGSDSEQKVNYITVTPAPVAPSAAFTADVREEYAPLTVRFTNQSTGTAPLIFEWDFTNDDEYVSQLSNPTFTYSTPGTYTVKLTVTNIAGSDTEIKSGYITVNEVPVAPVANFIANKRSGSAPLTVRFTDSSTGSSPLEYAWDFDDDGDYESYSRDPTFTYTEPDTYTVKLRVTNPVDTDSEEKTGYITVTECQPGGPRAGVALTFDDTYIDQWYDWYTSRNINQTYNAHVTFFVSEFGNLDEDEIDKLLELQAAGNEIAFHGLYHTDAALYIASHNNSVQEYLDYEIIPGLDLMRDEGFNPVDFAYPGGSDDPAATAALQDYFGHIRDTYYAWDDTIYYEYGSDQPFIKGIGIDENYGNSLNDIYDGISTAKEDDTILIFYGHEPVPGNPGAYQTSYSKLENILINVTDNDMKFYTVSELT